MEMRETSSWRGRGARLARDAVRPLAAKCVPQDRCESRVCVQAKLGERAEQALRRRVPIRLGDAVDKNLEVRLTPLDDITVRRSENAMHTLGDQPLNEKIADVQSMTSSFRRRFLTTRPRTRMRPAERVSSQAHTPRNCASCLLLGTRVLEMTVFSVEAHLRCSADGSPQLLLLNESFGGQREVEALGPTEVRIERPTASARRIDLPAQLPHQLCSAALCGPHVHPPTSAPGLGSRNGSPLRHLYQDSVRVESCTGGAGDAVLGRLSRTLHHGEHRRRTERLAQ